MFWRGKLDGSQSTESRKKEGGRNGEGTKDVKDEEGENPGAAIRYTSVADSSANTDLGRF